MIIELPSHFSIGSHKCIVRDRTITIDDVAVKIPKREAQMDEFILWGNKLLQTWGEEFKGDPETLKAIYDLADAIEDRLEVYERKKPKPPKSKREPNNPSSPPAPPCWFYNPVYEERSLFTQV